MAMTLAGLAFENTGTVLKDVKAPLTDASLKDMMDVVISTKAILDMDPPKEKLPEMPFSNAETNAFWVVESLNAIGAVAKSLLGPAVAADTRSSSWRQ